MASNLFKLFALGAILVRDVAGYRANEYRAAVNKATTGQGEAPSFTVQTNATANATELTPEYFLDRGSKRVEMRYGPFSVQPMNESNGMNDYIQVNSPMPCDDCTFTYIHAGLEYPDGSYANANTSLWLHHVVFLHLGVLDTVCGNNLYAHGQRWFASGNERSITDLTHQGKIPMGYYWPKDAVNLFILELMNQAMVPQEAVLTVTFEWVPGSPSDFYAATPAWLDIDGCDGDSDKPVLSNTTFHYDSPTWTSEVQGPIIGMGGHLHDGGVYLNIVKDNETICQPHAFYGQTAGYWDQAGIPMTMNPISMDAQMSMGDMRMPHISSMGYCQAPAGFVNPGDVFGVDAFYNFTEYAPMLNSDGSDAEIMGISLIYIAANMTTSELDFFVGDAAPNPYPDGPFIPYLSPYSPIAPMVCVPPRDSPGTLSAASLDLEDYDTAMLYLMAILDDACLQVWSQVYAHSFWAGVAGAILIATLVNRGQMLRGRARSRSAGKISSNFHTGGVISHVSGYFRAISYPQITNSKATGLFKFPPFGTSLIIAGYTGFICLLTFLNTNTHDDQRFQSVGVRAAWISVAQIPLIVGLANKRNFIGMVSGVTYERLNVIHRWTARGLLLTTTLHFGYQSYGWARLGLMQLEWNTDTCPPTGIAAYAFVLWMNISTLAPFRNMWYEFFVVQHILTFVGLIATVMYHIPDTALSARNYIWAAIAIYIASRFFQTVMVIYHNMHAARASLTPVSPDVTKIVVPSASLKSWTPGSHLLLRFPSMGFHQSHPLTIASTPTSHSGNLLFFVRSHTGLTRSLHKKAVISPSETCLTLIDGPYGASNPDFGNFSSVVLIASSTGVTFTLPILLDLADRASKHRLPVVKRINFVWTVRDRSATSWLSKELKDAIQTLRDEGVKTDITIHITGETHGAIVQHTTNDTISDTGDTEKRGAVVRTISTSSNTSSSSNTGSDSESQSDNEKTMNVSIHSRWNDNVNIANSRADIPRMLNHERDTAQGEVGVAVCGNTELSVDVRNSIAKMQLKRGNGVFLHVEGFAW